MFTKKEVSIIALICVLIGGALGLFYLLSRALKQDTTIHDSSGTSDVLNKGYTKTGLKIPEEVHTYIGKVIEIGDDSITVLIESHNNYVEKDAQLHVAHDEKTRIVRFVLPKHISADTTTISFEEEIVGVSDIQIGNTVQVHSEANIKDQTSFIAGEIKILGM